MIETRDSHKRGNRFVTRREGKRERKEKYNSPWKRKTNHNTYRWIFHPRFFCELTSSLILIPVSNQNTMSVLCGCISHLVLVMLWDSCDFVLIVKLSFGSALKNSSTKFSIPIQIFQRRIYLSFFKLLSLGIRNFLKDRPLVCFFPRNW